MTQREAWLAVVEDDQGEIETELVTLTGVIAEPGGTIETTDGRKVTFTERAAEMEAA